MWELLFRDPAPVQLYTVHQEYAAASSATRTPYSNFLRGVQWSPDGACLLTASDDNCLRIYDTPPEAWQLATQGADAAAAAAPEPQPAGQRVPAQPPAAAEPQQQQAPADGRDTLAPALRIQEGELLYDWCWFSAMSAADPASCCLAATGRAAPIHLWDAITGELRCTYRAYNEMDEVAPAHSLAFSPDGARLYCGFGRGTLRAFRVERPGRDCETILAHKKGGEGLPGIISCLAPNPDRSGLLAAGSFGGGAAVLDPRSRELLCLLEGGHAGGVTHLCFSADGNFLYTGARRDGAIRCWDVRYQSGVVYTIQRHSSGTNQRMQFDVEPCGRHLATGGEDGVVRVFDLRDGTEAAQFQAADDTVNGVGFHPVLPLLATASGQRRYFLAPSDGSSSDSDTDMAGSGSSSGSGSEAEGEPHSVGRSAAAAAAAAAARGLPLARENVLGVWRCGARPVQLPEVAGDAAEDAAAEDAAGGDVEEAAGVAAAAAPAVQQQIAAANGGEASAE